MHVSPAKHSYAWLPRKCDYRTDRQTSDKVIPMCCFASQATQKLKFILIKVDWHKERQTRRLLLISHSGAWNIINRDVFLKSTTNTQKLKQNRQTNVAIPAYHLLPRTSGIHYSLNGLSIKDQRSLIVNLIKSHRHIDRSMFWVHWCRHLG